MHRFIIKVIDDDGGIAGIHEAHMHRVADLAHHQLAAQRERCDEQLFAALYREIIMGRPF